VIPARFRSTFLRDIEDGPHCGCENETFEGGALSGGVEDGERPGDGGIYQGFGTGGTC